MAVSRMAGHPVDSSLHAYPRGWPVTESTTAAHLSASGPTGAGVSHRFRDGAGLGARAALRHQALPGKPTGTRPVRVLNAVPYDRRGLANRAGLVVFHPVGASQGAIHSSQPPVNCCF